ncbi:MAG: hypothetical protein GX351_04620 [Peptococcaceae bacterium]|nr:hypothetical protein [Peptococcaceae bacterium]
MATIFNKGTKKKPLYYIIYHDINEFGQRERKWISVRKHLGLKRRATHTEAETVLRKIENRLAETLL